MATNITDLNNSAITKLAAAMSRMKQDSDFADLTVTCGDKKWEVHSNVLAARSPFFKAAISTNMAEKLDMKIDIKELDSETMDEVINFMYGMGIGNAPIKCLLEAGERFQMEDLKEDVVKLAKNVLSVENAIEIGQLAEMYNLGGDILNESAQFIVKNGVPMKEDDLSPKLATLVISIFQGNLRAANQKLKIENIKIHRYEEQLQMFMKKCADYEEKLKVSYFCRLCDVNLCDEKCKRDHLNGSKHAKKLAAFESS